MEKEGADVQQCIFYLVVGVVYPRSSGCMSPQNMVSCAMIFPSGGFLMGRCRVGGIGVPLARHESSRVIAGRIRDAFTVAGESKVYFQIPSLNLIYSFSTCKHLE